MEGIHTTAQRKPGESENLQRPAARSASQVVEEHEKRGEEEMSDTAFLICLILAVFLTFCISTLVALR